MIGRALKVLRKYKALPQYEMATLVGISGSFLSGMETGQKKITFEVLERYAKEFDAPLSSLIAFAEGINGDQTSIKRMDENMLRIFGWAADNESFKGRKQRQP